MCTDCLTRCFPGGLGLHGLTFTSHLIERAEEREIDLCDVVVVVAFGLANVAGDGAIHYRVCPEDSRWRPHSSEAVLGLVVVRKGDRLVTTYRREIVTTGCIATLAEAVGQDGAA